jgi:MoxR-like ATPase
LLEAMQEKQVSAAGHTMRLEEPFVVYATQNPIEHEGTYPLPEAQLDRFFFCLNIQYPSFEEERRIVLATTGRPGKEPEQALSRDEVLQLQDCVLDVPVPDHVLDFALRLVSATRPGSADADDFIKKYVEWGAGPRASQTLTRAAKALALLRGNAAASEEDVREIARPVLRHRVIPNYNATGDGVSVEAIVDHLLKRA